MHLPSVSSDLASQVRRKGAIDQEEFSKLIMHWFPAVWSLLFTLRRNGGKALQRAKREDDDSTAIRLLRALAPKSVPPPDPERPTVTIQRVCVPDRVGTGGVVEMREVLASDAMRRCAETKFRFRLLLEDPESLLVIPEGIRSPSVDLPPLASIEGRFPRACEQVRHVVSNLHEHGNIIGRLDVSHQSANRDELTMLMAMHAYRLRLEREYGVCLAYQWPGIVAAAPYGESVALERFRSSAEQILAIHNASS
jgi:hypothetical protein